MISKIVTSPEYNSGYNSEYNYDLENPKIDFPKKSPLLHRTFSISSDCHGCEHLTSNTCGWCHICLDPPPILDCTTYDCVRRDISPYFFGQPIPITEEKDYKYEKIELPRTPKLKPRRIDMNRVDMENLDISNARFSSSVFPLNTKLNIKSCKRSRSDLQNDHTIDILPGKLHRQIAVPQTCVRCYTETHNDCRWCHNPCFPPPEVCDGTKKILRWM